MRKGFAKVVHGWHTQALEIIGRRSAKDLLLELADNAPGFQLGNKELAKRLKISDRSIQKNLELLHGLGLIERNGKLTPRGYKRNLSITAEARRWITEGILPAHLSNAALNKICEQTVQEKFPNEPMFSCNDSLKSEGLGDKRDVQEKFPNEPKFAYKKNKNLKKENYTREGVHNFSFTSPAGLLAKQNSFNAKTARDLWRLSTMRLDMGRVVDSSTGAAVSLYQDHDVFDAEFRRVFAAHLPDYLHSVSLQYSFQANGMRFAGQ